jgi:hypothetical protein
MMLTALSLDYTMAKNNKGMVCCIHPWEFEATTKGEAVDCRNHRHLSRRRAFELTNDARFADRILVEVYGHKEQLIGAIVEMAGRVRWAVSYGENWNRPEQLPPTYRAFIDKYMQGVESRLRSKEPISPAIQLDWE